MEICSHTVYLSCLIALAIFSGRRVQGDSQCDVAPEMGCRDRQTAKRCGVLSQCAQIVWGQKPLNSIAKKVHAHKNDANKPESAKVNLTLYYESLCPDCESFFRHQLNPNFERLKSIMDLCLVPYGNANETKEGSRWVFECQHGHDECLGNIIETCSIDIIKDINVYFPFIGCMEVTKKASAERAKDCATHGIPLEEIMECATSDRGNKLEHEMALKTKALDPPHTWVPWVTVNGVNNKEIQQQAVKDLVELICKEYKGLKPSFCNEEDLRLVEEKL